MSKAAILGISLGGLVILLMILAAAFKPQRQPQFIQGSFHKPGNLNFPNNFPLLHKFLGGLIN